MLEAQKYATPMDLKSLESFWVLGTTQGKEESNTMGRWQGKQSRKSSVFKKLIITDGGKKNAQLLYFLKTSSEVPAFFFFRLEKAVKV